MLTFILLHGPFKMAQKEVSPEIKVLFDSVTESGGFQVPEKASYFLLYLGCQGAHSPV